MDLNLKATKPAGDAEGSGEFVDGDLSKPYTYNGQTYTPESKRVPRAVAIKDAYLRERKKLIDGGANPLEIPSLASVLKADREQRKAAGETVAEPDGETAEATPSDLDAEAAKLYEALSVVTDGDAPGSFEDLSPAEQNRMRAAAAKMRGEDPKPYLDAAEAADIDADRAERDAETQRQQETKPPAPPAPPTQTQEPAPPALGPDDLPDDFPHVDKLRAQKVATFSKLAETNPGALEGIGDRRWSEIQEAVAARKG